MKTNEIIENNLNLVPFIIKKYFGAGEDFDEMLSVGYLGLTKAANSYDENMSKFSTYAGKCIMNEIYTYLRKNSKVNDNEVSINTVIGVDELEKEITFEDALHSEQNVEEDFIYSLDKSKIKLIISELSEKRQKIMNLKYFSEKNYTNQQISDMLNIPTSTVTTNICKSLQYIKRRLK